VEKQMDANDSLLLLMDRVEERLSVDKGENVVKRMFEVEICQQAQKRNHAILSCSLWRIVLKESYWSRIRSTDVQNVGGKWML
jgi:hypothetical protein